MRLIIYPLLNKLEKAQVLLCDSSLKRAEPLAFHQCPLRILLNSRKGIPRAQQENEITECIQWTTYSSN